MLDLTREEKIVLLFLLGCFIVGAGVNFYKTRQGIIIVNQPVPQAASHALAEGEPVYVYPAPAHRGGVNINTADFGQLVRIKGIGRELASRIIEFREENGPFFFKEDIMKVKGIAKGRFESIKDYITTE